MWRKRYGAGCARSASWPPPGRYALAHNVARLADDHARARRLASALGADPERVDTNIVVLEVTRRRGGGRQGRASEGVLVSALGPRLLRLVTHLDVDDDGIDRAIDVLAPLVR